MNSQRIRIYLMVGLLLTASGIPAHAVNKDMVQLETQMQSLVDQVQKLQQSNDERMGVMRSLIEQTTDNINKINANIDGLTKALQQEHTDTNGKVDQVSAQVQQLNDSVDELKARIAKVSKQLEDVQSAQQNLAAPPPAAPGQIPAQPCVPGEPCVPAQPGQGAPGVPGTPGQSVTPPAQAQAPPPDVLYNNALRDYNAGKYDLAVQEFGDYLKFYPTTDLAGNAQFYLADIEYRQGDYQLAIQDYDKVLEQYPGGNKTAAAQLKKGFALLAVGQKDAGAKELRSLVARYPRSLEASQARDRLHRLATAPAVSRRAER